MEFASLIEQLPNFAGLVLCVMYLWMSSRKKDELIETLINVIVKRENCDDDNDNATARTR